MRENITGHVDEWRRRRWILIAILFLGLLIRAVTIGYELDFSFGEQEQRIVNIALKMGATANLNPYFITKGVLWYILLAEYALFYAFGRITGRFQSSFDFAKAYFVDRSPFYLIDRLNQLVLAMLSIWILYKLAKKLYGDRGGIWAMAFGAAAAYHIEASRFAVVDMLNALFGAICLYQLLKYLELGKLKHLLWSVLFAAGTCSAKLHAGVYLFGILGVLMARREFARAAVASFMFLLFYALWTPAVVIDPVWSYRALKEEIFLRYVMNVDQKDVPYLGPAHAMINFVMSGLTVPGIILFCLGLKQPAGSRSYKWLGMVAPMLIYLAWLSRAGHSPHYLTVIWPQFSLFMAGGAVWLAGREWGVAWGRMPVRAGFFLGALVIACQLFWLPGSSSRAATVATKSYFKPEEAHQMIRWIRTRVPRGSRIAVMAADTWKNRLFPMPEQLRDRIARFENLPSKYSHDYNVANEQMYRWILRIVETDSSVPAFHLINLDVRTEEEQDSEMRRLNLKWIEDVLPYERWKDVESIGADYFLFDGVIGAKEGRLAPIEEALARHELVAAFAQFKLYRLGRSPPH